MRSHRFWTDRLSEALDGTLPPAQARALEDHLIRCPPCRRVRDEVEEVRRRGRALTPVRPHTDLWSGIAEELHAPAGSSTQRDKVIPIPTASPTASSRGIRTDRPDLFAPGPLRAAVVAGLLLALGAAFGAGLGRGGASSDPGSPGEAPPHAEVRQAVREWVEPSLFTELRALEDALRMDLAGLDPETQAAILGNLETIDRAIRESLGAIRSDPESRYLRGHLGSALERKVGFLQSVTRLLES